MAARTRQQWRVAHAMKFGFTVPTRGRLADPDSITRIVREGEALGFDFASVNDHIVVPRTIDSTYPYSESGAWQGQGGGEALELLTMLAFMAGISEKLRLLTAVMVVPYRNPVLTARILATADILSKGRITVGCGAGWLREEFEALGTPPFEARGRVADEYLRVFKKIWTDPAPEFAGDYAQFKDISVLPLPVQKPHPPLWIGGESGPALRRAARLGDGWFPIGSNPKFPLDTFERYKAAVDKLHALAEAEGRDPGELDLAYSLNWTFGGTPPLKSESKPVLTGTPEEIAADIECFEALGLAHLLLNFQGGSLNDTLDRMAGFARDVIPLTR
ncbi:MAG: TIGR03619 family F420-dependent LLM class oxidoreductase [Pseudolabrys sp.]